MTILLSAACGYNPTLKKDAEVTLDGAGALAGAIAGGSTGTAIPSDWDAASLADTSRIIGTGGSTGVATGGKGGLVGMAGAGGNGGASGATGAGGVIKQDAGPALPDAPVTCPAPVAPANGKVDPKSLNVGGQAIYTCDNGYGRPSLESRTCQSDGTWSGTNPTCAPVDCGNLENPKNGKVTTPSTTYKSVATYSCEPNYGLSAAAKRTCQESGTWSGTAPTCQCEQKMCYGACVDIKSDVANCGECGKVCPTLAPSTAQCIPTGCLVTLVRPNGAGHFVLEGPYLYWSEYQNGTVNRLPILGGAPTILANGLPYPGTLVIDAGKVYWGSGGSQPGINAMLIAGSPPATLVSEVNEPRVVAVNSTHIYYFSNNGIARIPLAGGDSSLVVSSNGALIRSFLLDSTNLYWLSESSPTAGNSVYKIMKQPLAGGDPVPLVSTTQIKAMAVDATHVYWTTPETSASKGSVSKVPLAGGAPTVIASGLDGPEDIVVDGTYVYWTGDFGGQVVKLPVAGGTPTILIASRWLASSLAIDATSIYWHESRNDTSARTFAITKLTPR